MSRREDLAAALENVESNDGALSADFVPPSLSDTEPPESGAEVASEVAHDEPEHQDGERARDAQGRFAKTPPQTPDPAAVAGTEKPAGAEVPAEAAAAGPQRPEVPKSWKQEMRGRWDQLDAETAAYIAQREQEMSRGIEQFQRQNEPALSLFQEVAPYVQDAAQRGFSVQQFVADAKDLFHTRDLLMKADPQTKLQTIVNIAHAAGLPLGQMLQGQISPDQQQAIHPQVLAMQQQLQAIQNNLAQRAQAEQQQTQAGIDSEISAFAAGDSHPHFEALRETMANLLQAGIATDLDGAYSKALRLHDDLWQQEQARQRQSQEQEARARADKAARAARSNAVSTRSATPGATAATTGGAPKGRRAALESAFDEATTSRI